MSDLTCYICLCPATEATPFCDPGCECSSNDTGSMRVHYTCLAQQCAHTGSIRCSVCRQTYMGISLVVARASPSNQDLIEEFTYYDGRPHGMATMSRKGSGRLIAEHWYEEGRLITSHLYSLCGEWIETVMEYTDDAVREYWRYNRRGDIVDYENYADMPERGAELRYAVTAA